MKKANFSYLAVWAGIPAVVAAVLVILAFTVFMDNKGIFVGAVFVAVGTVVAIPMLLESRMKKLAKEMEADFKSQGFTYQYKFEANNAVYYVDQGGKMGAISDRKSVV